METVTLRKMLETMDSGATFSIGFRTRDEKKDKGGEWIEFPEAMKHNYKTAAERLSEAHQPKEHRRNPNHYENSTRNIKVLSNGNIIKIHIRLVRMFNGKTVL